MSRAAAQSPAFSHEAGGGKMNKNFWKQFAIALALFLLGYFTFSGYPFG
jgi:hypothetical protein